MTSDTTSAQAAPKGRGVGRIVKWIALIGALVLIAAIGIAWLSLNGIVRRTVESSATKSLDLKTTLGGARVSVIGGTLNLSELSVASPAGYTAPSMLSVAHAGVQVSLGDLRGEPVHVKRVTIDSPRIVLEAKGTKLNVQALADRPKAESSDDSETMKVIIDEFDVTNAQVALRPGVSVAGLKEEYAITLPSISMKNIGTGSGAQNGAAIRDVVVSLLTTAAAKTAESDQLPPELRNLLSLNVDAVKAKVGAEIGKQIENVTEDIEKKLPGEVGKQIGDVLKDKDAGKAVEGIFGGAKESSEKKKETGEKNQKRSPTTTR